MFPLTVEPRAEKDLHRTKKIKIKVISCQRFDMVHTMEVGGVGEGGGGD